MKSQAAVGVFAMVTLLYICVEAKPSPLYFYNPFAVTKPPEGETENVSTYTTTEHAGRVVTAQPSVYHQIARNVLERIATPVFSHFVLAGSTEKSARIVSTTKKTTPNTTQQTNIYKIPKNDPSTLELLEETALNEDPLNSTATINNDTEEILDKELVSPKLVERNPSFGRKLGRDDSKPERITLYPVAHVQSVDNSEVRDLNESGKKVSTTSPDDNENEVDPDDIVVADERADQSDDDDESDFEDTETRHGRNNENSFLQIIEFFASIITLAMGAIGALFNRKPEMN